MFKLSKRRFLTVSQVGGLGDVVAGLGKALQEKGHLVEIVLPKYDCMQYESIKDMKVCLKIDIHIITLVARL